MKGIVFDIKKFSVHDGPGIRQTVFLKGCPLNCWWCHNPESQDIKSELKVQTIINGIVFEQAKHSAKIMTVEQVFDEIKKDEIFFDETGGGVTFSGGEPLMQQEFLNEILEKCKKNRIHSALDTTGFANENVFAKIMNVTDLFLFDLKLIDNALHKKYTGVSNSMILKNLETLSEYKKETIIRFPVIPTITDTQENINSIIKLLKNLKFNIISLLPYHTIADHKYTKLGMKNKMKGIKQLTKNDVLPLRDYFISQGFKVQIGG